VLYRLCRLDKPTDRQTIHEFSLMNVMVFIKISPKFTIQLQMLILSFILCVGRREREKKVQMELQFEKLFS
jgi:hypothetical protein